MSVISNIFCVHNYTIAAEAAARPLLEPLNP